ncbi:MAG: iron-containing alcohol dehydrogenase [Pseudomonadota bacterium]|uniref:iron-containing alcohol dehydrogenase n=1 Tax=Phenylobacterium sp. TaxID=1871053 RepID=UPI0025E07668|nr:iron-containing alcohol dehydrogenase [Phenylobacterium sp.]MBT9470197.1 iron-containing alcohol dehydrogenase [Phenylobacterium sp.]
MRLAGVQNFPPMDRVLFGQPAADMVLAEAQRLGATRVYLVVSHTLNTTTNEIEMIRTKLGDRYAGTFDRVPQHTTRANAVEIAKAATAAGADLLAAVGGGSVVDVVKIVTMCMEHEIFEEDGLDGYELTAGAPGAPTVSKQFSAPRVRSIVVPTTLSGGEYNAGALVTDTRRDWKQVFHHPLMMPHAIILDPQITLHTPETLWLGSGTRSMDHGIEALCAKLGTPLVDAVVTEGIGLLAEGLRRCKSDPTDLEARRLAQYGSWLSAFGLQTRVPMGASHAIGHVLGGTFGVPHYLITPVLMPHVLRYNRPATEDAQRRIAAALGAAGRSAADAFEQFIQELGLPGRLSDVGIEPGDYQRIGEIAVKSVFAPANPRPLNQPADIVALLETVKDQTAAERA